MRALFSVALSLAFLVLPMQAQAQWKWRDAQGRVTLSDRPPPQEVPAQDILSRPQGSDRKDRAPAPPQRASDAARNDAAKAPASGADPELDARRKKQEQEQQAKLKEAEEKQAGLMREQCQRARSTLVGLESGIRVVRTNASGEREVLDDAQREAEIARTRELIAQNCKS
jgi:hypothetical protein